MILEWKILEEFPSTIPKIEAIFRQAGWSKPYPPSMFPEETEAFWKSLHPEEKMMVSQQINLLCDFLDRKSQLRKQKIPDTKSVRDLKKFARKIEDLAESRLNWLIGKNFINLSRVHAQNLASFSRSLQQSVAHAISYRYLRDYPAILESFSKNNPRQTLGQTFNLWMEDECPIYFLGHSLCEAILQTDAPKDPLPIDTMNWPLENFAVILPKTIVMEAQSKLTGGKGEINLIGLVISRTTKESVEVPETRYGKKIDLNFEPEYQQVIPGVSIGLVSENTFPTWTTSPNDEMLNFVATLIHIMVERPRVMEKGNRIGPRTTSESPSVSWSPSYIGRNYIIREKTESVSNPDVIRGRRRMHWRCGHWRYQRIGKGRRMVKHTWIDPILINGRKHAE